MYNTQAQLPVPFDRWDESTINHNLPAGNDVWPQVQLPPNLDPTVMARIAAEFRTMAQSRLGRSPLHNFQYNLFSQNRFGNPMYTEWVQRAADFTEFLVVAQNNAPDVAIPKAVGKIYRASLAITGGQYPQVAQMIDQGMYAELLRAGEELNDIVRDVTAFQQAGRRPMVAQPNVGYANYQQPVYGGYQPAPQPAYGGYQAPQAGMLPPVGSPSQYRPQPANMAPSGYQTAPVYQTPVSNGAPRAGGAAGRYVDEPATPAPTSWDASRPTDFSQTTISPPSFNAQPAVAVQPEVIPDLPIPKDVDEVEMNPHYYVPTGKAIDPERPFDVIYVPGGAEVRPAHLSGWKRTRSAERPYALGYDPTMFVLFHVKWPDGVVHEKVVEWEPEMEYLKHEINAELRGAKIRPKGKIVANYRNIVGTDEAPKPVEDVKLTLDHDLLEQGEVSPVELDGIITTSTELESEVEARKQVIEQLGLDADTPVVPAYQYQTARLYSLDVSEEAEERLLELANAGSLVEVAEGLDELLNTSVLPLRYYRFINERLTAAVNAVLADNLSLDAVSIDSFTADMADLLDYLKQKQGEAVVTVFNSQTRAFLKRWLNFCYENVEVAESEEAAAVRSPFGLIDECVNLQTTWSSEQIASLNLGKEPVLISQSTHPKISNALTEFVGRLARNGQLAGKHLRLITTDGVYLEVLRGWLIEKSVLLKKVS
jgi:hypothetical protein